MLGVMIFQPKFITKVFSKDIKRHLLNALNYAYFFTFFINYSKKRFDYLNTKEEQTNEPHEKLAANYSSKL